MVNNILFTWWHDYQSVIYIVFYFRWVNDVLSAKKNTLMVCSFDTFNLHSLVVMVSSGVAIRRWRFDIFFFNFTLSLAFLLLRSISKNKCVYDVYNRKEKKFYKIDNMHNNNNSNTDQNNHQRGIVNICAHCCEREAE